MAKANSNPIESLKHSGEKRVNIPTEELRDFVAEDEAAPSVMLYPRDPSLDPQLVWKGKDEQDREDLAVPVAPIYIQEKIEPQALIEDLRERSKSEKPEEQLALFSDFNGLEFEELVDFYHHEQHWTNRLILGDSLLVMTSLAEKEGLKGKVQMIYMDPPYGIEFGSNWQVSTRKRDVKDRAEDATRQPEQIRAFRDTWKLGIHSYLAYLRDRFSVAFDLLSESGSFFIQIGSDNVHLLRCLLDEVFGSENFLSLITFRKKTMPLGSDYFEQVSDYILWYAKSKNHVKTRPLLKQMNVEGDSIWSWAELTDGFRKKLTSAEINNHKLLPSDSRVYRLVSLLPAQYRQNQDFNFNYQGYEYKPPRNSCWKTHREGMRKLSLSNRIQSSGNNLQQVLFEDDYPYSRLTALWGDTGGASDKVYVVQTSSTVVQRCILASTDPGDLVLDPTCGSGTTAYAAEQWGRRWITTDTSRVAITLARTRLMSAKFSYYLLADTPEGQRQESELTGHLPSDGSTSGDIKKGFVYKRVPHITLKSIANNEEIDAIHAKWQEKLEPVREELNRLLKRTWEEWEIPVEAEDGWPERAKALHDEWRKMRRERQAEMDASIARRADTELLYDQPYEDNRRVRVAGPFTVESLSPHRVLPADEERPAANGDGAAIQDSGAFVPMILDNLKKAGVQNTKKDERLKFDRLEPFAGTWLHAEGEYSEKDGRTRRAAISIGPERGTVGPEQVKEAAKEAMKGAGFDLLIVCGFAFDAHAGETAKEFSPPLPDDPSRFAVAEETMRFGKLPVLLARMNPDLSMGDELLKKTGAGNLFMVFGEPDIDIRHQPDGKIVAQVNGVDVYDPTTGQIRSSSTDDIACWFIDTDYNGESFFVRHAYFTGADEPYEKLKRALRAEIDEAAWSSLYSTKSRPFDPPKSGKIAVKVINHYGDEVLKVYDVPGSDG